MKRSGILIDANGNKLLAFHNGEICQGTFLAEFVILQMSQDTIALFREYEEIVSQQSFSWLSSIERRLDTLGLAVIWEGEESPVIVEDVQLAGGKVSFRVEQAAC